MRFLKISGLAIISIIFTFCSAQSDKELFEEGIKLINEKAYDEAVLSFEKIFNDNKESEFASTALFETAKLYQGKVIKNLTEQESLEKAVKVYKTVIEEYPESIVAENSLFMAAFIQANELHDFNGAKESYELFINKFPDGQLVDDAKVELGNLGRTPEDILKGKN